LLDDTRSLRNLLARAYGGDVAGDGVEGVLVEFAFLRSVTCFGAPAAFFLASALFAAGALAVVPGLRRAGNTALCGFVGGRVRRVTALGQLGQQPSSLSYRALVLVAVGTILVEPRAGPGSRGVSGNLEQN
jgi:hypothetical protein